MGESKDAPVTADDIETMADEIRRGVARRDSTIELTAAHHQVWDDLLDQADFPRRHGRRRHE